MANRFTVEAVFKAVDRFAAPVRRMQRGISQFTRTAERSLRRVDAATSRVVGGMGRIAGFAGKTLAAGFGIAATAAGLLVREFSKIEDAEAAFTPLLGGVDRARQMVEALNTTAASTPFQFETLADTANQLLPVMNGNIENTIKTMQMLGDTAGGNAQKLESITRGFTKAALKGKTDLESLNMIAEAGVPIFGELAAVLGTEVGEKFFKRISAGEVSVQDLTRAFERMTQKGGIFFRGMEIASETTSGLMSTLKDNIALTAAELGGVLAPAIKDLIRGATAIAIRVRTWVKENRELIASRFDDFVQRLKSGFSSFLETLKGFTQGRDILDDLKVTLAGIADIFRFLKDHGATIAKVVGGVLALSVALKTLAAVMTVVNLVMMANPIGLVAAAVAGLAAAWAAFIIWPDKIIAKLEKMPGPIRAILAPFEALARLIQFIKDNGGILGAATAVRDNIRGFLGFGDDDEEGAAGAAAPRMFSPQERGAMITSERIEKSSAEVTIRDETGRAEVSGGKLGKGLNLVQSGAF